MWRPRTEAEIQAGIENGITRESPSFDAKQQLPPAGKNKDLAKDICAMTVDGGGLLYGLGGKDPTRPDELYPFDLAGAAERVDQVAQAGIAEPPVIETYDIPSEENENGKGFLCVVIPASPRAPHMLTTEGDNRYWGRGAAGNRILSEGEVARLYERRERWEVDRGRMLDQTIASLPFTLDVDATGGSSRSSSQYCPGASCYGVATRRKLHDPVLAGFRRFEGVASATVTRIRARRAWRRHGGNALGRGDLGLLAGSRSLCRAAGSWRADRRGRSHLLAQPGSLNNARGAGRS